MDIDLKYREICFITLPQILKNSTNKKQLGAIFQVEMGI